MNEVLDWSKIAIFIQVQQILEAHFLLWSYPDTDLFNLKTLQDENQKVSRSSKESTNGSGFPVYFYNNVYGWTWTKDGFGTGTPQTIRMKLDLSSLTRLQHPLQRSGKLQSLQRPTQSLHHIISKMIHTASLVHNDILDKVETRRGKVAINKKWDACKSTYAGDYI